jgi:spore coat protein U-like protein
MASVRTLPSLASHEGRSRRRAPRLPTLLTFAAAIPWCTGGAYAATTSSNAAISATIINNCDLATVPDMDFGSFAGSTTLAGDQDATAKLVVTCSNGASYTVYLGDGLARLSGGARRMQTGASAFLPYQLYQDNDRTVVWDETGGPAALGGTGGVSGTGAGTAQTIFVYGRIVSGTVIPGLTGQYSDSVLVTVTY